MVKRGYVFGLASGIGLSVLVVACGGASLNHKYYPYDYSNHTLIGAKPEDDLSDSVCKPTLTSLRPCIIILADDFFAIKAEYLKTKSELNKCQQPK